MIFIMIMFVQNIFYSNISNDNRSLKEESEILHIIKFDFETYHNPDEIKNPISNLILNDIRIPINLGTPSQTVSASLRFYDYLFFLSSPYIDMQNLENKKNIYINDTSSSYKFISHDSLFYKSILMNAEKANETFYFENTAKNKLTLLNTTFYYSTKLSYNQSGGVVGLCLEDSNMNLHSGMNFLTQLKRKKAILYKTFFIKYKNKDSGELIIGAYPHEYSKKEYKYEKYIDIRGYTETTFVIYGIIFDQINFGENDQILLDKDNKRIMTAEFRIEFGFIQAPKIFEKNITDEFIDSGKCEYFRIGKGKNCIVFNAYDLINKRQVAIKKIEKSSLTLEDLSLLQTEVDTLKVCQHPYVVKFYETIETYNEFNIILEYCELGNLFYYLSKSKFVLDEEQIATYVHDISKAVYSMHNLGIIHRDLKLSNIALTKKNNKIEIRILDFGLSKILGPNQFCNEGYGTPGYAAPEVINRYNYSFEADIWSIGVICYFLFMKKLPFDYVRDGNNEMDMVENTLLDEVKLDYNIMRKYSKNAEKFIRDLMNKNTFDRPNITEVLEHPWFQLFFRKEVKKRIINTYKEEFYSNPDIDELYTYDENIEKENSKDVRDNYVRTISHISNGEGQIAPCETTSTPFCKLRSLFECQPNN